MIPLYLQLENRYSALEEIRESLWNLEGEVLTDRMLERLSTDFYDLDIDTGATSDLLTPYFLPQTSFPSCREMSGDLKDRMLDEGQNRDGHDHGLPIIKRLFPTAFIITFNNYAAEMREDLKKRISNSE